MENDLESVSYCQAGYQTLEGEIEEHQRSREHFRRILLCSIRGHLRQENRLRWWTVLFMAVCFAAAWLVANAIHSIGVFSWLWLPGWGVIAAWPIYVLLLRWRAGCEARQIDLAGYWNLLQTRDELEELKDRKTTEYVNRALTEVMRRSPDGNAFAAIIGMTIVTVGTWAIWDLLRTVPETVAEIILDGVITPANPEVANRISSETWYKYAFARTALHFFGIAVAVTLLALLVQFRSYFTY